MTDLSRPNHWTPGNEQQMRAEQPRLALVDLGILALCLGALIGAAIAIGSIW